ncbi:MAG TPA: hypothetical protein VMW38_11815 [Terriglobia bacterium]|nr:hypothetical protein [Terriglobia bacterium]
MNPCVSEKVEPEMGSGQQRSTYSLFNLLTDNGNDFSDHDLAVLADWANVQKQETPNQDWKRAFALIREGADLLLRRRARSSTVPPVEPSSVAAGTVVDYLELRKQTGDFASTFYGPHGCSKCGVLIVKQAIEQGGKEWTFPTLKGTGYFPHKCSLLDIAKMVDKEPQRGDRH